MKLQPGILPPFSNKIFNPHPGHNSTAGGVIASTGFYLNNVTTTTYYFDEDGRGNLRVYYFVRGTRTYIDATAGTVDYVKGEVIINTINITETVLGSGVVEIQAYPESNDIIGLKDLYLQLDMSNTKINIVRDTISSGQQISGLGYKVTSSYNNGTITRS